MLILVSVLIPHDCVPFPGVRSCSRSASLRWFMLLFLFSALVLVFGLGLGVGLSLVSWYWLLLLFFFIAFVYASIPIPGVGTSSIFLLFPMLVLACVSFPNVGSCFCSSTWQWFMLLCHLLALVHTSVPIVALGSSSYPRRWSLFVF